MGSGFPVWGLGLDSVQEAAPGQVVESIREGNLHWLDTRCFILEAELNAETFEYQHMNWLASGCSKEYLYEKGP